MKKKEEIEKLRAQDSDSLLEKLNNTQEELLKLRLRHASGQLEQTATIRRLRREVARVKTVIRQQQA